MKIQNDTLQALLAQQELLSRSGKAQTGFDAALDAEMTQADEAAGTGLTLPPPGAGQAGLVSSLLMSETEGTGASMDQVFTQASGALDMWDDYITRLGDNSSGSLRGAYAVLEGLDEQVSALRRDAQSLQGQNPGLDSLVNELAVMTTTEKFKFNRGDYTA